MLVKQTFLISFIFLTFLLGESLSSETKKSRLGKCSRRQVRLSGGKLGTIETPDYPTPYRKNQICWWQIKVPKGYFVHLAFHDKFDIACTSKDSVAVSSRKLYYRAIPRGSGTTAILCGKSPMSNVSAPGRQMWIRFHAKGEGNERQKNIGFRATYRAIDNDECRREEHTCEQNCINTIGSYRCSCNRGYMLDKNGLNCTAYKIVFKRKAYSKKISQTIPKYTLVLTVNANVIGGENISIKYRLIRKYPKSAEIGSYPFRISSTTGEITSRRLLPEGVKNYQMQVQAEVKNVIFEVVPVEFTVSTPALQDIRFSSSYYSVVVSDDLKKGDKIFDLPILSPKAAQHIVYNISGINQYFSIHKYFGTLTLKRDLSELKLLKNSSKKLDFTVVVRLRQTSDRSAAIAASTIIHVIVIPAFSGDTFNHLVEKTKADNVMNDRRKNTRRSEFAFHRFFRQLSPTAQNISKAEVKFDKIIKGLRESVVDEFTDQRLQTGGPIITNLSPISLASLDKLAELINATHCVIPKANCSDQNFHSKYRTFDGTCNNPQHQLWGAASVPYNRIIKAKYWDTEGYGEPYGFPRQLLVPRLPSPHLISERYVNHRKPGDRGGTFSHMMMQWGQFLDHDITFTAESEGSEHCALPKCDGSREDYENPCYPIMYPKNRECTMFTRSAAACQTDPTNIKNREQLNLVTSYIDGSQIYGSSLEQANTLREFTQEYPGFLKVNPTNHLMPDLDDRLNPPLNLCHFSGGCFAAGDLRANEQIVLASMHTLWVHEHNRVARILKYINQDWDSERIFQEARKIVIAELQHITYHEFLPKFLGKDAIPAYTGYNENVDATIYNAFATSAFRAGHSMVRPAFSRLDENYEPIGEDVPLVKAFFNNTLIQENGYAPFILGLLGNVSETINRGMAEGLTKHLFQQPGSAHGFDLAALNIQRGRDHGLPGYGAWRRECGIQEAVFFDETDYEITSSKARNILDELYGVVEHSDLWVAGLAEDHVPGAMVGPTFHCILKRQFTRLRDADRFWYEKPGVFSSEQLVELKKVTLSRVICDNLYSIVSIQPDAFLSATGENRRVECHFGLPIMDMNKWKEEKCSDCDILARGPGSWSDWVYTKKTSTGSWALADQQNLCHNHTAIRIECATIDDKDVQTTGEHYECDKDVGFFCRNIEQDETTCSNYKFRLRCSATDKIEPRNKPKNTGVPTKYIENTYQCNPELKKRFFQVSPLQAEATQAVTISSRSVNNVGLEYLNLGRDGQEEKHRFLIQFDLERIPARARLLSATLQLFLVNAGNNEDNLQHTLEVYPITSTEWHESNTTSVVPWNKDYLGINEDVDKSSVARSGSIQSRDREKWINIDVLTSVFKWKGSTRRRNNYGFMIKLANEEQALSLLRFASNAHANTSIHPKLHVCLVVNIW